MKRMLIVAAALLLSVAAWAQNAPGGQGPMGQPSLTDQGFSEAEAKTIQADLKAWDQSNREWEADLQLIDAQRNRLMIKESLDKGELEKTFRAQYDLMLKRDLARIDLMAKWRQAYGLDKAKVLDGMIRGQQGGPQGQGQGPGQGPGQPQGGPQQQGPGQPQGGQNPPPKKP